VIFTPKNALRRVVVLLGDVSTVNRGE